MTERQRRAWEFLIERLSERGSMVHLVNVIIAATGVAYAPEYQESIVSVSLIFAAVVGVLTKEDRNP